jgi:hypothetical protein
MDAISAGVFIFLRSEKKNCFLAHSVLLVLYERERKSLQVHNFFGARPIRMGRRAGQRNQQKRPKS